MSRIFVRYRIGHDCRRKVQCFTEKGAKVNSAGELVSGIDYLKELGVTTVQLAPFADFDGDSEYEIFKL